MTLLFFIAAVVAVAATVLAVTRANAVHALLYLIVSLLAVADVMFLYGAPFAAALEVIIYAGAIMVLFVYVVVMLNLGSASAERERRWLHPGIWIGPGLLSLVLLIELGLALGRTEDLGAATGGVGPKAVGIALFGPYLLAVELASLILTAGLIGAYHLGRRRKEARS